MFSSFVFLSTFNPKSGLNYRMFGEYVKHLDSSSKDGSYYMGADQMAQAIIYFTMLHRRLFYIAIPCMIADVLWYGPSTLGGPVSALGGFFMFL